MKIDPMKSQQISAGQKQIKKEKTEESKSPSDSVIIGGDKSGNLYTMPSPGGPAIYTFTNASMNSSADLDDINSFLMGEGKYSFATSPDLKKSENKDAGAATFTFMYDTAGRENIKDVKLKGSFSPETGQYDPQWNKGKGIPMYDDGTHGDLIKGDGIFSLELKLDKTGHQKEFAWDVVGDVYDQEGKRVGKDERLIMQDEPIKFKVDGPFDKQIYRPTTNHLMGVHKAGEDGVSFCTWSPEVGKGDLKDYKVYVEIYDKEGNLHTSKSMKKDPITGNWHLQKKEGWKELEGMGYRYAVKDDSGNYLMKGKDKVAYSDPYSRYLQGQQRGVERIFVDPVLGIETGWYDDSGKGGCNYADNPQWGRFTVDNRPNAEKVQLVLMDENGKELSKKELLDRLGAPKLLSYNEARPEDKRDVDTLNRWGVDTGGKVTDYQWTDGLQEDGTISMKKVGDAWVSTVNNFEKLEGLKYEFRVYQDGKLVGDKDGNKILSDIERKDTPFNDPYSNIISDRPGAERLSLIKESSYSFSHDLSDRKTKDPRKFAIYEAHVGSFMGSKDNANPSSFKDMIANLDYIEKLGTNTIELMPTNEFGGKRDWGYTPDYYFAGAEAYGFEMPADEALKRGIVRPDEVKGKDSVWVHGTDAVKIFVDEAHKKGFNVFCDVVYNHTSGKADADNPMAMIDGEKESFFKWWGQYTSESGWGKKPNFSAQEVKQFYTNNAVQQLEEFHFDGIRFDFTQVLHDTGSTGEKYEGMQTLRKINKTVDMVKHDAYTVAEDFSRSWLVASDYDKSEWVGEGEWRMEKKGMGFDAVWNDRFHDDLVGAVEGLDGKFSMDRLLEAITCHVDVADWSDAVVYAHSHDEVGNSGQWVARMAAHSQDDKDVEKPYPRSMARTAAAITLTGAGVPMIFQGEEFLDNADYKHGITSTWGNDISWLDFDMNPDILRKVATAAETGNVNTDKELSGYIEKYSSMTPEQKKNAEALANKRGQFDWYRDLIKLREKSDAFNSNSEISRLYTHNADRVMAYKRKGGNDEYIVVSNFSDQDRHNYGVGLPPGKWKEILNSDSAMYGGENRGNSGAEISGNGGIRIAPGTTVVLKKVG